MILVLKKDVISTIGWFNLMVSEVFVKTEFWKSFIRNFDGFPNNGKSYKDEIYVNKLLMQALPLLILLKITISTPLRKYFKSFHTFSIICCVGLRNDFRSIDLSDRPHWELQDRLTNEAYNKGWYSLIILIILIFGKKFPMRLVEILR